MPTVRIFISGSLKLVVSDETLELLRDQRERLMSRRGAIKIEITEGPLAIRQIGGPLEELNIEVDAAY